MGFADLAHCFMPDHLHAAVEGRNENADLKAFVARMKQCTAFYFKKTFGSQLWQRYGYEHVIRHDEPTRAITRYILENPIRAGLVQGGRRLYRFIGSSEYRSMNWLNIPALLPAKAGSYIDSSSIQRTVGYLIPS